MVKLPINRKENVRRMLRTGKHQTTKNQTAEEIWLIYFLKNSGKKKEEIFEIWKPFYFSRAKCEDVDSADVVFDLLLKESPKTKFYREPNKFCIYMDEIEKINSIYEPLWVKEYILFFIAWYRANGEDIFEKIPTQDIYKRIHKVSPNESTKRIINALIDNGFIKKVEMHNEYYGSIIFDEFDPMLVSSQDDDEMMLLDSSAYSYCFESDKSVKIMESNCCQDVSFILPLITNKCKCKKCGAEFEFNEKTKREICDVCWNGNRQTQKNILKSIKRGQEK